MASAGLLDPTKAGKYPVVLSDALLGKDSSEVYTGVRCNHKPNLSSPTAPDHARLKPTASAKKGASYDLSFLDNGSDRYTYQGTRRTEDGQYVLIFDAAREVFVLHKVDSMFNMNLIRTPTNSDADSLRREYPQLEGSAPVDAKPAPAKTKEKDTLAKPRKPAVKEKQENSLPMPKKPAPQPEPAPKKPVQEDSEDESSDDDFGLTIENPGGEDTSARSQILRNFSPAFGTGARRFSEFLQQNEREASGEQVSEEEEGEDVLPSNVGAIDEDDADGEDDDDDDRSVEYLPLPSPMNRIPAQDGGGGPQQQQQQQQHVQVDGDESEEDEDEGEQMVDVDEPADDADALEAELMAALEETQHQDQESDVSEEE
ncbi:hypothetical protein DL764_003424 [Monosporascus ibericus]|uniref:Transcription elongation factor Eaf N-terminal domain-containing protein n=1 Tax=Monosporascus ibericus TaxID=155417 RepID=A0A4Q4TJY8_9PEZI|nr:hypothetical protein DL764_003424 [Monosporascus ibericus]